VKLNPVFLDVPVLGRLLRRFTVHPYETMFDFPAFGRALDAEGLHLVALRSHLVPGWHRGVAVRD